MARIIPILLFLALVGHCFAPILDPRMKTGGLTPTRDPTAAEMAEHQARMKSQGEIGNVPVKTTDNVAPQSIASGQAANIVAGASADEKARAVLLAADAKLRHGSTPPTTFALWGLAVLALGYGGFRLAIKYGAKDMPPMPATKRVSW